MGVDQGPVITARASEQMACGALRVLDVDIAVGSTGVSVVRNRPRAGRPAPSSPLRPCAITAVGGVGRGAYGRVRDLRDGFGGPRKATNRLQRGVVGGGQNRRRDGPQDSDDQPGPTESDRGAKCPPQRDGQEQQRQMTGNSRTAEKAGRRSGTPRGLLHLGLGQLRLLAHQYREIRRHLGDQLVERTVVCRRCCRPARGRSGVHRRMSPLSVVHGRLVTADGDGGGTGTTAG